MTVVVSFKNLSLTRFLEEIEHKGFSWMVKRLSGNDTGLTGGHQAGLYLPRAFVRKAIPEICSTQRYNPDAWIEECYFPAQNDSIQRLRATYYNSKHFPEKGGKNKRDEFRLTRWGGSSSPVQDKENTGSIFVFAVGRDQGKLVSVAWVAASVEEEDLIEKWLGCEVEPGNFELSDFIAEPDKDLSLPEEWSSSFPSGKEIFSFIVQQIPRNNWTQSVDKLLLKRRKLEFKVFKQIEREHVLPKIKGGFSTVEVFFKYANSLSNRRKSRTGTSLELNLESIFMDERIAFETQVVTENRKKPDFLFPSGKAYHDLDFPSSKLQMMAAKTCCKDRWRQILNEADRITPKHLFTLQEGVSGNQLQEMNDANVELVVPEPYFKYFPEEWRRSLITLDGFIEHIRAQQAKVSGLEKWIN